MADDARSPVTKYTDMVAAYEAEFKKWEARVVKLLKKYRDENRTAGDNNSARFNILWAMIQTLVPAVYARMPKADVSRRFVDNDPVGRVGALLIERCLDYEIEHYSDFRSAMHNCVLDRFLGGRGVAWVRYDPTIVAQGDGQITEDVPDPEDNTAAMQGPDEEIAYECSPSDYVYWKDFGHSPARTWEEVTIVWRWVYMTEPSLKKRFPETWKKVPIDSKPQNALSPGTKDNAENDRAKVCELWDKEAGKVYWFAKGMTDFIDERDDPLDLEGFFPTPKPLYATLTTDSLVPVPDYALYQDQANELDILSDRIDGLIKALRVRGIYDASQPALQRLLTEGENNTLVGTDKWAAFSEKGGLKGSIDLIPVEIFANALMQCYQARRDVQAQIYEITGMSDIVRGQGAASESATAQQIKGQYAGLRLKSMQETVAIFASELIRIKAQIICSKYQDSTIMAYAGVGQMTPEDQQLVPQAMQLIRNDPLRAFRIEVNADSLVQIDERETKQERTEFLGAMANFLREAVPAGQQVPEMVPSMMAMLQFAIAGYKQARTIEGTLDAGLQKLIEKAKNPPPDPEMQKAQAEMQADAQKTQMQVQAQAQQKQAELQQQAQLEQMKAQQTAQMEQARMQHEAQMEQMKQAHEAQMEQMKQEREQTFKEWDAKLKASTTIEVALIGAGKPTSDEAVSQNTANNNAVTESVTAKIGDSMQQLMEAISQSQSDLVSRHDQLGQMLKQASGPKRIIRGPDGRAIGVEPMQMQ